MSPERNRPTPYWVAECTATLDQGVVEAWFTELGRPALACDVCNATWFDPELEPDAAVFFDDRTGRFPDGDALARPASQQELAELGWWELVTPLSRETNDRPPPSRPGLRP
jgi:hypothetical protein